MNINGFEILKHNQYNLPEGQKTSTCPLCSHKRKKKTDKCLMIFWEIGLARCFHCGELLQIHTFKSKEQNHEYVRPKWDNNTELPDHIVKWFEARKISQFTLNIAKISYQRAYMPQYKNQVDAIRFNYFRDDELINIKYRTLDKKFMLISKAELIFYNLDSVRMAKEIYITEGEMDCLSLMEVGIYNVVSVPNGAVLGNNNLKYLDNCIQYFENKEKIFLVTDNDEPGKQLQKEFVRRLGAERCFIFDFKYKDANELLMKEGKEALKKAMSKPLEYPLENIVTIDQIPDLWEKDEEKGFTIGFEPFDEIFSTYTGQFITITGIPTHGKSDWVDFMTIGYAYRYDWPIAYASPENIPQKIHYQKLWKKIAGKRAANSNDEYKLIFNWIKSHFYLMDFEKGFHLIAILNKALELIKRKGIKCLVIDPYNKAVNKESKHEIYSASYTAEYLQIIDEFCRVNDILIILVAHPRKPQFEKRGYEPGFYDIKGGGEFFDMSPHGLLVHRNFEDETAKIKVLKCKFQNLGTNNAEIITGWNPKNGRYCEINSSPTSSGLIYDNENWLKVDNRKQTKIDFDSDYELIEEMPF